MDKEFTQEENRKVDAELRKAFPKLSNSDLILYKIRSNREKFISTVVEKQGIDNATATKRLKEVEAACGCGSAAKVA